MSHIQRNINRMLGQMAIAKHLDLHNPEKQHKRDIKAAREQALRAERTIAACEEYRKGKKFTPEEQARIDELLESQKKLYEESMRILLEDNPTKENFERYMKGI